MVGSIIKHTIFLVLVVLFFILLVGFLLNASVYGQEGDFYDQLSQREKKIAAKMERIYLGRGTKAPLKIFGDYEIKEDESIRGNILLAKGTLLIKGEVDGDVLVLFGDVELDSTAFVDGDVIAVDGKVWLEEGASVHGDIIERGPFTRDGRDYEGEKSEETYINTSKRHHKKHKKKTVRVHEEKSKGSGLWFNYNRVDGLTLGLLLPNQQWWRRHRRNFAVLGKVGYSFASKGIQYRVGLERWLFDDFRFSLGAEIHDLTDTQDRWIIDDLENTLAAMLIKEDFRDYYNRTGYSFYLAQKLGGPITLKGEYRNDDFSRLVNLTNWSVFGKNKRFRPNPRPLPGTLIDEQWNVFSGPAKLHLQSAVGTVTIDTRNDQKNPTRGWYIQGFYERAGFELESDMDFERYILDIRRYQPLGWDENLDVRIRAGAATGVLPPMYWFDLGGISTLRGYRFKEFTGDRMVLGNLEYRLKTSGSDWFILDDFDLILFVDSGLAWFANGESEKTLDAWPIDEEVQKRSLNTLPDQAFRELSWGDLKTNVGIALASADDEFRINFAKRTDRGNSDIVITFRITKPF